MAARKLGERTDAKTAAADLTPQQFVVWVLLHSCSGSDLVSTSATKLARSWGIPDYIVRRALGALARKGYVGRLAVQKVGFVRKFTYSLERRLDASSGQFLRFGA